jgi:hypothetical protein
MALTLAGFTGGDQPPVSPRICFDVNTTVRKKKTRQVRRREVVTPVDMAAVWVHRCARKGSSCQGSVCQLIV